MTIYNVLSRTMSELKKQNLLLRANSIAFSFFLSLFPLLILAITIFSYIPHTTTQSLLETTISSILPHTARDFIEEIVSEFESIKRGGLLSSSFILAVYFSSNGMINLFRGFEKAHTLNYSKRSKLKNRAFAIVLTLLVSIFFFLALVLIIIGKTILITVLHALDLYNVELAAVIVLKWVVIFILFYLSIAIIYKLGPAFKNKIPLFNYGTLFSSVAIILSSLFLSYVANKFGTWNKIYGSLGSIVLILIWFQVTSVILLIGYEFSASVILSRLINSK